MYSTMDNSKNYRTHKNFLYAIIFSLILTPSIRVLPVAVRLEEFIIILFLLYIFLNALKNRKTYMVISTRHIMLFIFSIIVIVSISVGMLKGYSSSIAEYIELVKLFKYIMIYTIAFSFFQTLKDKKLEVQRLFNFIFKLSVILFFITLQQYFNLFNLNEIYVESVAPTQYETLVGNYSNPRPVAFIGNPNELGYLYTVISIIAFFKLLNGNLNIKTSIILIINVLGVLITLSRASLVALLIGVAALGILMLFKKKLSNISINIFTKLNFILFFSIMIITIVISFTEFRSQILWRFEALVNISSDDSWTQRLENWSVNLNLFKDNLIFGVGPLNRVNIQHSADNEWLLLLRSYGIVGTFFFILMFMIPHIKSNSNLYKKILLSTLVSGAVYMVPAAVFNSLVLMPLILILLSINDNVRNSIEIKV